MTAKKVVAIRMDSDERRLLAATATVTGLSQTKIVMDALHEYVGRLTVDMQEKIEVVRKSMPD